MRSGGRRKSIAFIVLGVALVGGALALNVGWVIVSWRQAGLLVAGLLVFPLIITGVVLNFPNWNQGREAMQIANVVHGVCAIFAMAMACFHIYLGTIGMQGAYQAMKTGQVDETWAKEHHEIWYNEVKEGKRPEKISGAAPQPATGD